MLSSRGLLSGLFRIGTLDYKSDRDENDTKSKIEGTKEIYSTVSRILVHGGSLYFHQAICQKACEIQGAADAFLKVADATLEEEAPFSQTRKIE